MHTMDDIIIFLNYYKENKLEVKTEHFLEAVSCVKNYQEFKLILDLFKEAGLKDGIRFYDYIVEYICSYEDCREILDYLKENAAIVNRKYFIQLMLLSANKEEARQIYNEFISQNTRTILSESLADNFGNEEQVMVNFNEKAKREYSIRGFKFRERVDNIKVLREHKVNVINKIKRDLDSEASEDDTYYKEGAVKQYYGKKYERNPENRKKAIEIHGLNCMACGFNFEEIYGNRGEDFIEIHHIRPLSALVEEMIIDPEKDLVPVCSNCHRMIHRRKDDVLSIEELKSLINRRK